MPDLKFTFPVEHNLFGFATYRIPAKSFLFKESDEDPKCHIGVMAQLYSDTDHFILGQVFMENFYVTYDANNPDQHRLGLSYDVSQAGGSGATGTGSKNLFFVLAFVLITVFVLLLIATILAVCLCMRKKQ